MNERFYPLLITSLPGEDGGGFLAVAPDLPGCMSDGETPEEAARNAAEAVQEWIDEANRLGRTVPEPGSWRPVAAKVTEAALNLVEKVNRLAAEIGELEHELAAQSGSRAVVTPFQNWSETLSRSGSSRPAASRTTQTRVPR